MEWAGRAGAPSNRPLPNRADACVNFFDVAGMPGQVQMTEQTKRQRGRPRNPFSENGSTTVQSLDRALGLLKALSLSRSSTLTDIAMTAGVPAPTAYRILATLQQHGFVTFDETRQEWSIGLEAFRVGSVFLKNKGLSEIGLIAMRKLVEATDETANLAIPDGHQVVFIGQIETSNPIRAFFPPGTRTPMHASGTGKAILAAMPRDAVVRLLQTSDLPGFTPQTHQTPDSLFADLDLTRERGWSFDREERFVGMSCVGSAIYDANGLPIAGVSISGPSNRLEEARASEFGSAVAAAAAEITRLSGGEVPA